MTHYHVQNACWNCRHVAYVADLKSTQLHFYCTLLANDGLELSPAGICDLHQLEED